MECPFCLKEIEKASFLSSPNFLAIYNRAPILPGHSLIIPRKHFESALDMPLSLTHEMMNLSMHAVRMLLKIFHAEAFDWTIQDGEAAGQTVPHVHLHLIPRRKGDLPEPGDWFQELEKSKIAAIDSSQRPRLTDRQVEEMAAKIRAEIRSMSQ